MSKGKQIVYSEEELVWIKQHCTWPRAKAHLKFCKKFRRPNVGIVHYTALCKRKGWLTGRTGCYDKGSVPLNKGKKCPPGQGGNHPNARRTQFKKGELPLNTKYLGHERISKDGYVEISIDEENPHTGFERRYVHKHRYLWEKKNGKIPADMVLKCLDSNRENTDPDNWKAIPRGALPFLNGHRGHNYETMPAELKPAVLTLAQVKAAKFKALKKSSDEVSA